jgi:hypothetical protein
MEKNFLTTLSLLKSKSNKIYEKDVVLFNDEANKVEEETTKKSKKTKPFYLKDLEREMILKE